MRRVGHPEDRPYLIKLGSVFGLSAEEVCNAYRGWEPPKQERCWPDEDALERKLAKVISFERRDPEMEAILSISPPRPSDVEGAGCRQTHGGDALL